ncbi:Nn.00g107810.m01.CDS01 [Neocucurbitaria sp. VM-36]
MLARGSSDAGSRLRRSKSTSTVHRHPPPILQPLDPDVAQQHALAAATAAFARAQVHDNADRKSKRSSEISRSKSNASRKSLTSQGSHFPPRPSSFRSSQPQKTVQMTSTQRQSQASTINTEQFPPFYATPSSDKPSLVPRFLSAQPSITFSENARPGSQPKSFRQSAASSITSQQIRKARSMYYASSIQTGSPIARPPAKFLMTPPPTSVSPAISTLPALPPTRTPGPSPLADFRIPVHVTADESIDNARDKYLQSFQEKTIKHKPSMFLAPFKKRQDKAKEKGKRITSGIASVPMSKHQTPEDSFVDTSLTDFLPHPEPKEKRSFSGSLKSKFKRVFRRTSNKSPNLPVQQIDASRDYFNTTHLSPPTVDDTYAIPSPDEETLQRVRSRAPFVEGARPTFLRSSSHSSSNGSARSSKSNRSLHSEVNAVNVSASRVTSWGTSSTGDTLTQRAIKRLTVIHEAKDSIGSETEHLASLVPKRKPIPLPPLAAFRDPLPMENSTEDYLTPVDPKRVFSALMREIGASNSVRAPHDSAERTPGGESDVFESSETKELHYQARDLHSSASRDFRPSTGSDQRPPSRRPPSAAAKSVQSKTSTIKSFGRALRSTIRTVTPAEEHSSPHYERMGSVRGVVRIPRDDVNTPSSTDTIDSGGSDVHNQKNMSSGVKVVTSERHPTHGDDSPQAFTPSATQIEQRVVKAEDRWKTPLDEAETLQFPRETNRTYNVTNFARQIIPCETLRDSANHVGQLPSDSHEPSGQDLPKLPASPTSPSPNPRTVMSPMSPSVYSRNTDGISIFPNDSFVSCSGLNDSETIHNGGSAVILTSQSVRSYVIGTPSPRHPDYTRTSRDWKAWLSHEISGMESASQEDLMIHERDLTPSGKHRRDSKRTSHTEHGDTTVILRETEDTSTRGLELETPVTVNTAEATVEGNSRHQSKSQGQLSSKVNTIALEKSQTHPESFEEVSPAHTPTMTEDTPARLLSSRPSLTPLVGKQRMLSTPISCPSTSQPMLETPTSSRMNDRFPFLDTGRRSSNNSAKSSLQSKSPADSIASLKSLKLSKVTPSPQVYSDLSAPGMAQPPHRAPNTALKRRDAQLRRKENATPPALLDDSEPKVCSLRYTSRPKSMQPLSTAALDPNTPTALQYMTNALEINRAKQTSSPTATPPRPRVRATLRPLSPEKLSRRPKSAFDLRETKTQYPLQVRRALKDETIELPLPRPSSELRRPALQLKTPSNSLALNIEPSPGTEERVIDNLLGNDRSGSVTPGQRMADRFLKQRKSNPVLESGKMRGGLRLIREDTPAFL